MAKEDSGSAPAPTDPVENSAPKSGLLSILYILNTVTLMGTLGFFVYTRFIYKKPKITEATELRRLASINTAAIHSKPAYITFAPVTLNIETSPLHPHSADGKSQPQGKLHYVTLGFALEVRDSTQLDKVEAIRPKLMDKLGTLIGKKPFDDLITVQGRYVLLSELLQTSNQLILAEANGKLKEDLVINVYFTDFVVQ